MGKLQFIYEFDCGCEDISSNWGKANISWTGTAGRGKKPRCLRRDQSLSSGCCLCAICSCPFIAMLSVTKRVDFFVELLSITSIFMTQDINVKTEVCVCTCLCTCVYGGTLFVCMWRPYVDSRMSYSTDSPLCSMRLGLPHFGRLADSVTPRSVSASQCWAYKHVLSHLTSCHRVGIWLWLLMLILTKPSPQP